MAMIGEERTPTSKQKLPIGIQDFETMRTQEYLYVDKTRDIYRMITQGMFYFLSRPRRFGKSLLVSTLKCIFQGKEALFEGLWMTTHGDWEWQEYPVLIFDFTAISSQTPEALEQNLSFRLKNFAKTYNFSLEAPFVEPQFEELIATLYQQSGMPVVVLIDEYDKPIIDHLGKGERGLETARANREVLKRFFGVLKSGTIASALRFIFLTGISRFSKVSIFSELNNLDDISMSDRYATLLGYTQEELDTCFAGRIQELAQHLDCSQEQITTKLAQQYDGYRFSEYALQVYNPFSILKAFSERKIRDYWFETATPSFLVNLLIQEHYDLPALEALQVSQSIFSTFDLERLFPEALLFQTGYITIKDVHNDVYTLGYPNQEVKSAFLEYLLLALAKGAHSTISSQVLQLAGYLRNEEFEAFFETMTAIFALIPYDIETKRDEGYFHTLFYVMLSASGTEAHSSVLTSRGRIDLAVQFPEKVYIIEFKCNQSAETALQQIQQRGYAEKYRRSGKQIILIGINFSTEQRNVAGWKVVQV